MTWSQSYTVMWKAESSGEGMRDLGMVMRSDLSDGLQRVRMVVALNS